MKIASLLIPLYFFCLFLSSCNSMSDAGKVIKNEKRTTDEFLIKKNQALTQPPDFSVIPEPGLQKKENAKEGIEKILNTSNSKEKNSKANSSSTEQSILNQIKK